MKRCKCSPCHPPKKNDGNRGYASLDWRRRLETALAMQGKSLPN